MLDCGQIDTLLEAYLDGDLSRDRSQGIRNHVVSCPDCRAKVERAEHIADELRSLPLHTCPETVVQHVFTEIHPRKRTRLGRLVPSISQLRPRYAFGLSLGLAVVLVALISLGVFQKGSLFRGQRPHYTEEEIACAKQQIFLAFGYVNYATSRTQQIIEKDVVPEKVIRPIQRSLDAIHTTKEKGDAS